MLTLSSPICQCCTRRPPSVLSGSDRLPPDADALCGQRWAPPDDAEEDEPREPYPCQWDRICPAAAEACGPRCQQTDLSRYWTRSFVFSPSPKKSINETRRLTHLLSEQIPPFRCESGSIRPAKYSRLSRPTAFLSRARRSATRWKRLRLCPSFSHSLHTTARQQEKLSKRHPQAHDGRDKNQPGMTTLTREHFSLLRKIKQLRHWALFWWNPQGSTGRGGAPHHQWRRILWSCRDTFRVQIGRLLVHTLSPGLPLSDRKEALEFVFDARHLDILKESLSPGLEVRQSATV